MTEELQEDRENQLCQRCKREAILVKMWEGYLCADCLSDLDL
jgi:hypothetical protein